MNQMLFRRYCVELFLCNIVPRVLRQHCTIFFYCTWLSGVCGTNCIGFFLRKFVTGVLRKHCTGVSQCNVVFSLSENIAYAILICAILCESISTTLNRIFPYAKLSGASRTTLHRGFDLCNNVVRELTQH